MSIKTFFQPWLIQPNPNLSWLAGPVDEYDPLQDAHDLTEEAASWVVDAVDQLAYAKELYAEVAQNALDEIARQRKRRVSALKAISDNEMVVAAIGAALPAPPEEPEPDSLVIEVEPVIDSAPVDNEWLPAGVDVVEEPVPPKRRRRKLSSTEAIDG